MRYAFVIDHTRCIGCHACTVACKEENAVPLGVYRTWVKYVERGTWPETRRHFLVLRCNHCEHAPCVTICPTAALHRRPDGIVDLDRDRCIGCKACMQACPYDALYLDPETRTAAKCHFCAHRIERGLEPACVIVCPERAILTGDLDDPSSEVSRVLGRQPVLVRKPEQGTGPRVFYVGADQVALTPVLLEPAPTYLWAEGPRPGGGGDGAAAGGVGPAGRVAGAPDPAVPRGNPGAGPETAAPPGLPDRVTGAGSSPAVPGPPGPGSPGPRRTGDARGPVLGRVVYDVPHEPRPWGWRVAAYLWTKSVAVGAALVAAFGSRLDWAPATTSRFPAVALGFLLLTTALLVLDLKRPARFLYLLFRPNPRSWLVIGAWILLAFGALLAGWLWAVTAGRLDWLDRLAPPLAALGLAGAGYSAFLFAQAEGRDFWQSPLTLPHLLVAAALAGAAVALVLAEPTVALRGVLLLALGAHLLLALAERLVRHPTREAELAARWLTEGPGRGAFWLGVVGGGVLLPALLLVGSAPGPAEPVAALLALAGLYLWEDRWVRAGQVVPLS